MGIVRRGVYYRRIRYCYGCQSCLQTDGDGNTKQLEHVIAVDDVTATVKPLMEESAKDE